jgi:hypothetical protein
VGVDGPQRPLLAVVVEQGLVGVAGHGHQVEGADLVKGAGIAHDPRGRAVPVLPAGLGDHRRRRVDPDHAVAVAG